MHGNIVTKHDKIQASRESSESIRGETGCETGSDHRPGFMTPFLIEPGEEMRLEAVTVENVRIHGEGQKELIRLKPVVNQYMRRKVPGSIRHIRFRDLSVSGTPGPYRVQLEGADALHEVGEVNFDRVRILEEPLRPDSAGLQVGPGVRGLTFEP